MKRDTRASSFVLKSSKEMFRILQIFTVVLVLSSHSTSNGCEITLQPDLNGGCTFDEIHLLHPSIGVELAPICGSGEIDIKFLQEQPIVIYPEAIDSLKYALVMVDKIWDGSVFLQWLVTDVNGSWLKRGIDMTDGKTIAGKTHLEFNSKTGMFPNFLTHFFPLQPTCHRRC